MSEFYTGEGGTIEQILSEHGIYASVVRGTSMRPLLMAGRDVVYILPITEQVKKYDVLLYRRADKYILHRVIGFYPDGYIIRGDNTYKKEYVNETSLVGILAKYNRRGKERSATTRRFYVYGFIVQLFYLPRFCIVTLGRKIKNLLRKAKKEN